MKLILICVLICVVIFVVILFGAKNERECYEKKCSKKEHTLVVCAIFKNENLYLDEWIKFHLNQGIEHFYLYDNNDTIIPRDSYNSRVTYIPWNNVKPEGEKTIQRKAYYDCFINYGYNYNWVLLLDIDEFIFSPDGESVINILSEYNINNVPYIKIPRYNFGSNNHKIKPDGGVLKNYLLRERFVSSYKSINNTCYIIPNVPKSAHIYMYNCNNNSINSHLKMDNNPFSSDLGKLQINHYITKSKDEHENRRKLWINTQINPPQSRSGRNFESDNKNNNEVFDNKILQYVK
jgi:hypothetical protein